MSKKNAKTNATTVEPMLMNATEAVEVVEVVKAEEVKVSTRDLLLKEAETVSVNLEAGKYRISDKSVIYRRGKAWTIDTTIDEKNVVGSVLKDDLKGIARTYWVGGEKAYQNKGLVYLSQIIKSLLNVEVDLNHERQIAREFIRLHETELTFNQ